MDDAVAAPYGAAAQPLPREFYDRDVLEVAADLLGCRLRHGGVEVRLTEVEAYAGPRDPGSHAYRGPTPRTAVMFGPPGGLYVYFSYGMHWCMNLVCGPSGTASAVLLRAGEVTHGIAAARERRDAARRAGPPARPSLDRELASGPARLARALGVDGTLDGIDVTAPDSPLRIHRNGTDAPAPGRICSGPRVGVSGAGGDGDLFPWRRWIADDPTVSRYRAAAPRGDRRR